MFLYPVESTILPLAEGNTLDGVDQLIFRIGINLIGGIEQVREELSLKLLALANF
jgi:hypothetical protein